MYGIPDFVDEYLSSEIKRGRVKSPRWFKVPVKITPESEELVHFHPRGLEAGLALKGLWEEIQRWCMSHWKRGGRFVMNDGRPMTIDQIAHAIGMKEIEQKFLDESFDLLMRAGWLVRIEGKQDIDLSHIKETGEEDEVIHVHSDTGKYSPAARYSVSNTARNLVHKLREAQPIAAENPRKLEQSLCDAILEGRNGEDIIEAMIVYYSLEEGRNKYRVRPSKFVENAKELESWDEWYSNKEAASTRAKILQDACDRHNKDHRTYCALMAKHRNTRVSTLRKLIKEWNRSVKDDGSSSTVDVDDNTGDSGAVVSGDGVERQKG